MEVVELAVARYDDDVLRLVVAYGLRKGTLAPMPPAPEREPYVPYCEATGHDYQPMSREMMLAAAGLWAKGESIKSMARTLRVGDKRMAGIICRHRELFPRRRPRRKGMRQDA